jgi:multiple sugar transport system substrate-binding protein
VALSRQLERAARFWKQYRRLRGRRSVPPLIHGFRYTAKDWYLKYGVGYAFKSLDNDPDIKEAHRKAGYDLDILSQQSNTARQRENIGATWYLEWDNFTQQQIQRALLRQVTPLQALEASAKKAQELKKNS